MLRYLTASIVALVILACTCPGHAEQPKLRLGLVLSIGGLGDRSFNDVTYEGVKRLRSELGCLVEIIEPASVGSIEPALEYLSGRGLDLVAAVGFLANKAMHEVAAKHPQQSYLILDSVVDQPNVLSIIFNEEEGSFYAGAFAGLLSRSGKIGFLGGMQSPIIAAFERGFVNGAKFVNPAIEVVVEYAGDTPEAFNRPDLGENIGNKMLEAGADFVFHASGGTGRGLVQAVRQRKAYMIGVDADQSGLAPGRIPASMVKRLDVALGMAVRNIRDGRFQNGILTLGLADAGIDLVLSRFNKNLITPLIAERLRDVETFLRHRQQ